MTYTYFTYLNDNVHDNNFIISNTYIREHVERITNSDYKAQSECGYKLLGKILSLHFGLNINELEISENEYGKPHFTNAEICFNISHSDNAIVCSVSDGEIGIDVEKISEIRTKISDKFFSEYERRQIKSPEDFYRLWTLKEAFVKFIGKGISSIKDVEFTIKPKVKFESTTISSSINFETFIIDNYVVSIASNDHINNILIEKEAVI